MLGANCNLCLTIRCSFKIFFMLGAHGNLRLTIRWSSRVFFFILVAHGNLCLAIRWSLKIHWYVGCPWQPMPGLHFARFCFKLPQQILLISEQPAGDKTTNNKRKQLGTVQASWTLTMADLGYYRPAQSQWLQCLALS